MMNTPDLPAEAAAAAASIEAQFAALTAKLTDLLDKNSSRNDEKQEEIRQREAELKRREAAAQARQLLSDRQLPQELADCLAFTDESQIKSAIDALEDAFRAAVQKAVEERLSSDAPKTGAAVPLDQLSDEEYYAVVCRND